MCKREITKKYEKFNHYHKITKDQQFVNFGTGGFVADKKRIPLLKAKKRLVIKSERRVG